MPPAPHRLRANGLLLLTAAIWGFAFVAQVAGARHVQAFTFNGARFLLGGLSLLPLIAVLDRRRTAASDLTTADPATADPARLAGGAWRAALVPGLVTGAALFLGAWLQQWGIESTTAGNGGFITGLYMVLVPVIGMFLGQRTGWNTWVGIGLAVAGLYLLSIRGDLTMARGDLLVLLGTVFWAAHILLIDHFSPRLDPLRLSVVQFLACAAYNLAAAPLVEADPYAGLGEALVPILYGGLGSVGIAYTLQVVAQRDAKPSHAAMILSLESLFAAVGGALLLGESMSARGYLGCALMLAGILVSQLPTGRAPAPDVVEPRPEPGPVGTL